MTKTHARSRSTATARTRRTAAGPVWRFSHHFLEMLLAMGAGMILLAPTWSLVTGLAGNPPILLHPTTDLLVMVAHMVIAMTVWMIICGHRRRYIVEMNTAMVAAGALPAAVLATGSINSSTANLAAHLVMVPAMLLVMLLRRHDYAQRRRFATSRQYRSKATRLLAQRWPTVLALLLTADSWTSPTVLPWWLLLVLGGEYLLIGAIRRSFPDRRTLCWQVAGFAVYAAAAGCAAFASPTTAGVLIGLGWLLHAVWDAILHRRDIVVWRWYAEACAVIDIVFGLTILLLVL